MIPFFSFNYQNDLFKENLNKAFSSVLDSKNYVLGKNVKDFEKKYSVYNKVKYSIGVSSGLDALIICLKAVNIRANDEVIVASNAYIACWLAISNVGAKIIPVEPNIKTFNIDPLKIEKKITKRTKAIMPVHLFGQPCHMDEIMKIANKYNLYVIEDNAQAHLSKFNNQYTGTFGQINATSFYPTKNLGALGEAGCVTTNDKDLCEFSLTYRNYGYNRKYECKIRGRNFRIDEIQASILNVKIKYLKKLNQERISLAKIYDDNLGSILNLKIPYKDPNCVHVYHLYVIRTNKRDDLKDYLMKNGIQTLIHYPIPPHLQLAYKNLGFKKGDFPIAEDISETSLSLPLYPGLKKKDILYICNKISKFFS